MSLQWEIVSFNDTPKTSRWQMPVMQKTSLADATINWQIGFNGIKLIFWRWHEGGVQTITKRDVKENASGRTLYEQAWLEAKNRYLKKRREGYLPPCSGEKRMIKIMRAKLYEEDIHNIYFPVDMDQKLDGMRMWCATNYPYGVDGYTRGNTTFPHVQSLLDEVHLLAAYLPPGCAVDGELWHPDYHLNEIASIVRSRKKKDPRMESMMYFIFDISTEDDLCQEERRRILESALADYRLQTFGYVSPTEYGTGGIILELVGKTRLFTTKLTIAYSHEDVKSIHEKHVADGFEGSILRKRANGAAENSNAYNMSRYIYGKSNHVLKVIDYIYEEGRCIGVSDAEGTEKGCAKLIIKDIRGNVFPVRPDGDFEQRKQWFLKPELVLGKYITIKYKQLSVHNKPLNVTCKGIRDEPGWLPDEEISMDKNYSVSQ